jgi:hypothetical protein
LRENVAAVLFVWAGGLSFFVGGIGGIILRDFFPGELPLWIILR